MLNTNRKLSHKGFSLIELMVAAVILSLAIFGIFQAFGAGFLGMFDARDRTVATNYVQEKMEELKNTDFDTVVPDADESLGIVGDIKFRRNVNVVYIDGSTNLIVAGPTNLKRVTTTVKWDDRKGGEKKVESSVLIQNTQFTPGDAARISLYADPYNVVLPVTSSTTIIAVIKDSSGNTIFDWDGSDVTFTIISEVSPEGDPPEGSLGTLSDFAVATVQGKASVVFTSSVTALQGTVTIEASVTTSDGLSTFTDTIDIDITWGAVQIELIPNPSSILADGTSQSTIIAIIENAAGERVDEALNDITFTVAGEGTLIGPTTKPANETYDSITGGVATILLQSTTTPGIATVTASSPELLSDSCDVQTSGVPAGITLSASLNPMYSDDTSEVTVTVVDENGVPVIPTAAMTIELATSEGILSDYSLIFDDESSLSTIYTPILTTEGVVIITATGAFTGSINISVELKLVADRIILNAEPFNIPADGGDSYSTITATIKSSKGITVHNYNEDVTFSIISGGGTLSVIDGVVTCVNGVATIQLYSGSIPGTCQIKVQDVSEILPAATIDVGFYTTADHILLTAAPTSIPVGGGNEGTSKLTAGIVDEDNIIVYNYIGNVSFTFLSGYNYSNPLLGNAKFKYAGDPIYNIPVFHGTASVDLISLSNAGVATLQASSEGLFYPDSDILTIYIQKTLKLAVFPNITYFIAGKNVSFDIEVQGGDVSIDRMKVTWSLDNLEKLTTVTIDGNIVSGNSGEISNGVDFIIDSSSLLKETTSTVTLTFDSSIEGKDISIIFYPAVGESYCAEEYVINL